MNFLKKYKGYVIFCSLCFLFFVCLLALDYIERVKLKQDYEGKIQDLKKLVKLSNLGEKNELDFDIYQPAEYFLKYYYGVSPDVTADYRKEQLLKYMTEDACNTYDKEYNNAMGYENVIDNIMIYIDYKNSSEDAVYACIFFYENIKWPGIDTLVTPRYWKGIFAYDYEALAWKVSEITECTNLYTEDDLLRYNIDTNESSMEYIETGEVGEGGKKE